MRQRLAISLAFVAVCFGVAIVPPVIAQVAQLNCCAALASGGVTSLNTLTGDVTIAGTSGQITVTPSGQTLTLATVPIPCPTAGANVTVTGTSMPNCTIAASGGGSGGVTLLPSPAPTTTPFAVDNGYAAIKGIQLDCNGGSGGPSACPNLVVVASGAGQCEYGNYSSWGTTTASVSGVVGQNFAVFCQGVPIFAVGGHGDVGIGSGLHGSLAYMNSLIFYDASTTSDQCWLHDVLNTGVVFQHVNTGICNFYFQDVAASSVLATDSTGKLVPASTLSTSSFEVTCSVTSATSCTATATVRSGAKCTATMESTDSTVAGPYYDPALHNASGTLSVTLTAVNSGTGNLAANGSCL